MKARPNPKTGAVTLELTDRDEPMLDAAARAGTTSPFEIKRILVPIDFSDCSKKALAYALPLARTHGAKLTLLYVVPPNYGTGEFPLADLALMEASLREGGQKELDQLIKTEVQGEVRADTRITVGSPAREIVSVAQNLPADLIVISTHGHTGLKHVFLGSVAEHVVQRAPCPVFVVRESEREILNARSAAKPASH